MGPTVSDAVDVGRAVWTSAKISSKASTGAASGDKAHIAGRLSPSSGVQNPPVLTICFGRSGVRLWVVFERCVSWHVCGSGAESLLYYEVFFVLPRISRCETNKISECPLHLMTTLYVVRNHILQSEWQRQVKLSIL